MKKSKLTPHRKRKVNFFRIVSAVISLFAVSFILCACSTGNTVSQKQATENLEKVFGDIKQLPMDIEMVKENLGEETIVSTEKKEGSKDSTEIFVGDGVVLYHSVSESASRTQTGYDYTYTIEIMHFGGAEMKGSNCNMKFIGANITMKIEAESAEPVKAELLNRLDSIDMSAEQQSVMRELIEGEQVYVEAGSDAWEMFAQVNEEVETEYDEEFGTFWKTEEPQYDDMYDQYSYEVKDFSDRVKQRVYYKVDNEGKKWITENYEFTYLSDGTIRKHSISYYDYTEQIWSEDVYEGGSDENLIPIWSKSYRDDGSMESELYHNEDGNVVMIDYFNDGSISLKRICVPSLEDGSYRDEIYWEEYGPPGVLGEKWFKEDNILTKEQYFLNGKLKEKQIIDTTRYFEGNQEPYLVELIKGFEDGSKSVFTFYDNGKEKVFKNYDPNGTLHQETKYMIDGKPEFEAYYHDNGKISYTNEYYKDGTQKKMGEYDKNGDPLIIITYYENGEECVEEQYLDGVVWLKIEYYEDGTTKRLTEYGDNGGVVNVVNYDENGNEIA